MVRTAKITALAGAAPEAHYLLAKAADGGVVAERETNNFKVLAIR